MEIRCERNTDHYQDYLKKKDSNRYGHEIIYYYVKEDIPNAIYVYRYIEDDTIDKIMRILAKVSAEYVYTDVDVMRIFIEYLEKITPIQIVKFMVRDEEFRDSFLVWLNICEAYEYDPHCYAIKEKGIPNPLFLLYDK